MTIANKKSSLILLLGDLFFFASSLWLALFIRHLKTPKWNVFELHIKAFLILFVAWIIIFFIAGLYEKYTVFLKSKLPNLIFKTQFVNVVLAALFFFTIPFFGITPKTILLIYLIVSTVLISTWRLYIFPFFETGKKQKALLIDGGKIFKELYEEINNNSRYNIKFVRTIDVNKTDGSALSDRVYNELSSEDISVVVVNLKNKKLAGILPHLYKPIFSNIHFIDANEVYEDIFKRISTDHLENSNFLKNLPFASKNIYDTTKRTVDIFLSFLLGLFTLLIIPFVAIAIKLEDGGEIFIRQERVGEKNTIITIFKFRTMERGDENGVWIGETENKVTKVGSFLRKTRIDELPQLFNVLRGDISLIGPRPDMTGLENRLKKEIENYSLRYLVKPGLSGWAQIRQDYEKGYSPQSIEETKRRLEFDLYYIKNRSFILDLEITFRTLKVLVSKIGQ